MKAMRLHACGLIEKSPLRYEDVAVPIPGPGEVLVKVSVCGICRTDLHLVEGELPNTQFPIIPGHQAVGQVVALGPDCYRLVVGDRVGIAWLRHTCQECFFCSNQRENLCLQSVYTGYQANGGYAEYSTVPEAYAYAIPPSFSDAEAAPLLCAGIIGYRAFKRAAVPSRGRLGIIGFGSSAHVTMQVALHHGCEVYVGTRDAGHQELAKAMGAVWVGAGNTPFPVALDSIILFAPAGNLVPIALQSLQRGGTLALAGIKLSEIPAMDYEKCLFHEKNLCSVEANTREDGYELLRYAETIPIKPHVTLFPLRDANEALRQLKHDAFKGSAVLYHD